eukprot:CAMPEP_0170182712 /NCGR_PEP_ID=MMETSP0040_2-20121228/28680_1 /TAXON_ID=641309 /ORGANISM="Lotharella oceanica, Strain CCMP622" /LENGTH=129 /DNA_ID=CAMNT_0010428235 /DNA_START=18 /DNA_END=404 /DNA_ORIENTATION=+
MPMILSSKRNKRSKKAPMTTILERVPQKVFFQNRVLRVRQDDGERMLREVLPKRADFCGAVMAKIFFEHHVSAIRRKHNAVPALSDQQHANKKLCRGLQERFDRNVRVRRTIAQKALVHGSLSGGDGNW